MSPDMFFDNSPEQILAYLQELLPGYPYRADLDAAFIGELAADFPDLDILGEIKSFRWYYDNAPLSRVENVRVALRRWIANANGPRYR